MIRGVRGALAVALTVTLLAACTSLLRGEASLSEPRIWDVRAQRYIDTNVLTQRVIDARFRLLGEVHDNPAHHALRAQLIDAIGRAGKYPAVVFEQFDQPNEQALRDAQRGDVDAETLVSAGAFDRRGWEWPLHEPVIAATIAARMSVHAGNASRAALEPVVRHGDVSGIDPHWRELLEAAPWNDRRASELARDIEEGHCGKLPASIVPRLALAQRVRDAALAAALLHDANADGAVLIAGNGHVRADVGVPLYLGSAAAQAISVGFIEVEASEAGEPDLAQSVAREHPGFDYLWLTDAVYRPDPCATIPSAPGGAAPTSAPVNHGK